VARSWQDIHRIAAAEAMRAHRELGVDTTRPIDPFAALERSGVLVMRQRLDHLAGAYLPANPADGSPPGVLINVAHPLSRQRYTAAHELWHHRRDRDLVFDAETEWLARGEDGGEERERLAEAFASWFLMPRRLVEATLELLGLSPQALDERGAYALSLELGTSYAATVNHLAGLRLISLAARNRLRRATPQAIKQALGAIDVAADVWKDVRLVGPGERARAVEALEGDALVLEVPEIPSSGYLWRAVQVPDSLNLVRDEYHPAAPDALGGEGIHRFVFHVLSAGRRPVRLELGRPWQQGRTVGFRDVEVVAEPLPAPGIVHPSLLVGAAA
jgi:Zn-dependent peptidase ImmA (M78 family)/predicted secreted protein